MPGLKFDVGQCRRGDVVEVTLSRGANVRLVDSTNLSKLQRGQRHEYFGGLVQRSPYRLGVPRSGHWYVVVDTQGLRNGTRASVRKIPAASMQPLPPAREARPELAEIAEAFAEESSSQRSFDVFISHASEDKDAVVRPLAEALREHGLEVWFDAFELRIGDSLRRKIDAGIASSRFGIVVLSKPFFSKGWTQYELDGLVTMSVSGRQVLLPLWHGVSRTRS